jgi:hypothetical protein
MVCFFCAREGHHCVHNVFFMEVPRKLQVYGSRVMPSHAVPPDGLDFFSSPNPKLALVFSPCTLARFQNPPLSTVSL